MRKGRRRTNMCHPPQATSTDLIPPLHPQGDAFCCRLSMHGRRWTGSPCNLRHGKISHYAFDRVSGEDGEPQNAAAGICRGGRLTCKRAHYILIPIQGACFLHLCHCGPHYLSVGFPQGRPRRCGLTCRGNSPPRWACVNPCIIKTFPITIYNVCPLSFTRSIGGEAQRGV